MKSQKISAILKNQFCSAPRLSILFLFVAIAGSTSATAQTVVTIPPAKTTVEVGRSKCEKYSKPVNPNVRVTVGNPAIAKASFNPTTGEFCVEGVSEGLTLVSFAGTFRQSGTSDNNNNGGMAGRVRQNDEQFTFDLTVRVRTKIENTDTNAPGLPTERGKNVRIFYTSLREYDAQKAAQLLQERGYVPDKKLTEDGEATQSQKKKLYCVLSSGGTEVGVRGIAELIKNIESVTTQCREDNPHTDPEYTLWIVSEKPFIAELEDYQKEMREASDIFDRRFDWTSTNNSIKRTYIAEFEKEGTGDWEGKAESWSRAVGNKIHIGTGPVVVIYDIPLEILRLSIYYIKEKPYSPTPEEVSHFRSQMIDWRTRKDELTRRLNEVISISAQDNSDRYANQRLKTLSDEDRKNRENESFERRKKIWDEIDKIKDRPVFAYALGKGAPWRS